MFSTCTLPRPFLHVKDRLNLTVYLYRLFCLIWSVKNHLIIFYTQENGGVCQRILQLGCSQAEILTIFVCPYMGIVQIWACIQSLITRHRMDIECSFLFLSPNFHIQRIRINGLKNYFATRYCPKCPYIEIIIYGHFEHNLAAKYFLTHLF